MREQERGLEPFHTLKIYTCYSQVLVRVQECGLGDAVRPVRVALDVLDDVLVRDDLAHLQVKEVTYKACRIHAKHCERSHDYR